MCVDSDTIPYPVATLERGGRSHAAIVTEDIVLPDHGIMACLKAVSDRRPRVDHGEGSNYRINPDLKRQLPRCFTAGRMA
jgi:hypothetical protein